MDARALLDSLDVGVAAIAPDWTVAVWSASAARITSLPTDRVLGKNFWVAFPNATGTAVERTLHEVLNDGKPRRYVTPAGAAEFTGRVLETLVTRGPRNHLVMEFREVHAELAPESRAAQILEAFETERRLFRQLFESLPIPALMLTLDGQILQANREGGVLLGVPDPLALRGLPLSNWLPAAMPTAFAAPWPSGPVVVSTPGVWPYSGWPGVMLPHCRNRFSSSSGRS